MCKHIFFGKRARVAWARLALIQMAPFCLLPARDFSAVIGSGLHLSMSYIPIGRTGQASWGISLHHPPALCCLPDEVHKFVVSGSWLYMSACLMCAPPPGADSVAPTDGGLASLFLPVSLPLSALRSVCPTGGAVFTTQGGVLVTSASQCCTFLLPSLPPVRCLPPLCRSRRMPSTESALHREK